MILEKNGDDRSVTYWRAILLSWIRDRQPTFRFV
jgi:hypothetical protein